MTAGYTPTTAQVEDAYVRAMRNAFIASEGEHREEFRRWLAAHNAEVAAAALEEADAIALAVGDAHSAYSMTERERAINIRDDEPRKSELAMNHALSLRSQASGAWEAAAKIRIHAAALTPTEGNTDE